MGRPTEPGISLVCGLTRPCPSDEGYPGPDLPPSRHIEIPTTEPPPTPLLPSKVQKACLGGPGSPVVQGSAWGPPWGFLQRKGGLPPGGPTLNLHTEGFRSALSYSWNETRGATESSSRAADGRCGGARQCLRRVGTRSRQWGRRGRASGDGGPARPQLPPRASRS